MSLSRVGFWVEREQASLLLCFATFLNDTGQRQMPGLHVLADLGIVVESVRELLQGLSPLDRFLPREGAHRLHQLEVGSLLVAEASHVAEFWHQVDGSSVSRPLLSDLNETIEDLRSK